MYTGGVDALFTGLFDDAAMFPPAETPMARALEQHALARAAWYGNAVGPFVCPAARLPELVERLRAPLEVALTVPDRVDALPAALAAARAGDHVVLRAVEVPGRPEEIAPDIPAGVTPYVELPWSDVPQSVAKLGAARAKFRTGGSYVPSPDQLGAAIAACVASGVPFKLTAGLHSAVRSAGQHGFLNVMLATAAPIEASALLGLDDEDEVVRRVRALSPEQTTEVRRFFVSFGTCSIDEPVEDLMRLGLMGDPRWGGAEA